MGTCLNLSQQFLLSSLPIKINQKCNILSIEFNLHLIMPRPWVKLKLSIDISVSIFFNCFKRNIHVAVLWSLKKYITEFYTSAAVLQLAVSVIQFRPDSCDIVSFPNSWLKENIKEFNGNIGEPMHSAPDVCRELFLNLQSSPSNFKDTEYWVSQYSPIGTVAKKKKRMSFPK